MDVILKDDNAVARLSLLMYKSSVALTVPGFLIRFDFTVILPCE